MFEDLQKDHLTGFFLRTSFNSVFKRCITEAGVRKNAFSIVLVDLDRFKRYNDKYGHPFGDEVIKYVAGSMRFSFMGNPAHFFRYGGDEFVALLQYKDAKEALYLVSKFKKHMDSNPFFHNNKNYKITASCGIASFPVDGIETDQLVSKADKAMYYSKRRGRNVTTLSGRVRYLKIRSMLFYIVSISIIVGSVFLYNPLNVKKYVPDLLGKLKTIKVDIDPIKSDIIIMKNGTKFKGRILDETEDKLIFKVKINKGSGSLILDKSQIKEIQYAKKKDSIK